MSDRRLFLSYRREGAAGHAGRLADHLLDRFGQGSVFMDVESIEAGADFTAEIERAIAGCEAVLVVIGPGWLGAQTSSGSRRLEEPGDFVRREIEAALSSEARVIPVLVGGASMPAEAELPASIAALSRRNAIELQDRRWREDVDALIDVLEGRERGALGNLPVQPTPFLGRERELAELTELLRRSDVRLLTLTGPGGIGKTRLAVQVAAKLAHTYPGGAWFVGLAALTDPSLLLGEIASVLEVREADENSLVGALAQRLSRARSLLVLDNLEQLLPEAAASIAELSAAAQSLDVIVSSREPLRVAAEREVPVAALSQDEAAGLFLARARATGPGFDPRDEAERTAIAEICARLDRLPLAIELAAARISLLPPVDLLGRLEQRLPLLTGGARDAPERQRTLRATIAWSVDLLADEERELFERLSVFSGGWTLEAAEAVCDADLDTMQSLLQRSLIGRSATAGRLEMLETIREFALELRSGPADDLARRHEEHYLAFAVATGPELRGPDPGPRFDALEAELGNFRAALDSSLAADRILVALRLVGALAILWEHRGHWREARTWMDATLARSQTMHVGERADVLFAAGNLAGFQGHMAVSRSLLEEAVQLAREVGDRRILALSLGRLAWVRVEHGLDQEGSEALAEEGLRVARDLRDRWVLAETLNNVAGVVEEASVGKAAALLQENLELRRAMRDIGGIADALNNLGWVALLSEDYGTALGYLDESLELAHRLHDRQHIALAQGNLGLAHLCEGDVPRAGRLFRDNLRLCWEIGDRRIAQEALSGLAGVAAAQTDWERAAHLAGASAGLAAEGELLANPMEDRIAERFLVHARRALGDAAYEELIGRGRASTFEQAVGDALGETEAAPEPGR